MDKFSVKTLRVTLRQEQKSFLARERHSALSLQAPIHPPTLPRPHSIKYIYIYIHPFMHVHVHVYVPHASV